MLVLFLADEPSSWMHEVVENLAAIHAVSSELAALPSPRESLATWVREARSDPVRFKRLLVKGAVLVALAPAVAAVPLPITEFPCDCCERVFRTKDALMSHCYQKHQYRNPLVCKVVGAQCAICAKFYFSTPRLLKHVCFGSSTCKAGYEHLMPVRTQQERDELFISPPAKAKKNILPPPRELSLLAT